MSKDKPLVSIGLPVYNGENFIREAIDSILAQTFKDFELIISDNTSTDKTEEICREYAAKDRRISYYRNEQNLGPAWNYNRVFELSSGKYFKWAAHDDVCAPEFLERCVEVLEQDASIVLCHPKTKVIDPYGKVIKNYSKERANSLKPEERFRDNVFMPECYEIFGLIRSSALRKTSLIGSYAHGDGILLAKLGFMGRFYEFPEYLFLSRDHSQQSMKIAKANYMHYTAWFDPTKKGKIVFPHWKMLYEYYRSLGGAKISLRERILCYYYLMIWMRLRIRILLGQLRIWRWYFEWS